MNGKRLAREAGLAAEYCTHAPLVRDQQPSACRACVHAALRDTFRAALDEAAKVVRTYAPPANYSPLSGIERITLQDAADEIEALKDAL